jgi:hypothetical protein
MMAAPAVIETSRISLAGPKDQRKPGRCAGTLDQLGEAWGRKVRARRVTRFDLLTLDPDTDPLPFPCGSQACTASSVLAVVRDISCELSVLEGPI